MCADDERTPFAISPVSAAKLVKKSGVNKDCGTYKCRLD